MYRRHRRTCIVLFVSIFFATFKLKADYSKIADNAVSVISIALAVYIGAASVILGSDFAKKLKKQQDQELITKTSLGVLASYLRTAGVCSLLTIIISIIYMLDLDVSSLVNILTQYVPIEYFQFLWNFLSSISFGLFAINVIFLWLILIFLINSMTKSV